MTEEEFRSQIEEGKYNDLWWVSVDGEVQDKTVNLTEAVALMHSLPDNRIHVDNADNENAAPEWIPLEMGVVPSVGERGETSYEVRAPKVSIGKLLVSMVCLVGTVIVSLGILKLLGVEVPGARSVPEDVPVTSFTLEHDGSDGTKYQGNVAIQRRSAIAPNPAQGKTSQSGTKNFSGQAKKKAVNKRKYPKKQRNHTKKPKNSGKPTLVASGDPKPISAKDTGRSSASGSSLSKKQGAVAAWSIAKEPFPITLISVGSEWRYLSDGSKVDRSWLDNKYNDSNWRKGKGKLGAGDENVETVMAIGSSDPLEEKPMTTYFRNRFRMPGGHSAKEVGIKLMRDDGAVVYINGEEVLRSNMPKGPIHERTPALSGVAQVDEDYYHSYKVDPKYLQPGENIIAVEIHQDRPGNGDVGFDLSLGIIE